MTDALAIRDDWSARITACWRQSIDGIIQTGRLLAQAKAELPHGEFLPMVETLPFKLTMVQRLIAIAADARISNAAHGPILPAHWRTLYELTKLNDETFQARIEDGTICASMERADIATAVKQSRRENRERLLGGLQLALPTKKYGVILADPEWRFEPWSRQSGMDRAADNHYPTSCIEVIASRDVVSIAADDCVLFLWATAPMLPHALTVMAAWGFDYKSNYVWAKVKSGTGYWNRSLHEHLLIGTQGNIPCPAPGTQWESILLAAAGEHSVKPEASLIMIEEYFPTLPKIELNRRGPARVGWDAWGNETGEVTSPQGTEAAA